MSDQDGGCLLWLSGITWDTPISDIGWTYIVLGVLACLFVQLVILLVRGPRP